jgi:hypothetical protein
VVWRREYGTEALTAEDVYGENETGKQYIYGYDKVRRLLFRRLNLYILRRSRGWLHRAPRTFHEETQAYTLHAPRSPECRPSRDHNCG